MGYPTLCLELYAWFLIAFVSAILVCSVIGNLLVLHIYSKAQVYTALVFLIQITCLVDLCYGSLLLPMYIMSIAPWASHDRKLVNRNFAQFLLYIYPLASLTMIMLLAFNRCLSSMYKHSKTHFLSKYRVLKVFLINLQLTLVSVTAVSLALLPAYFNMVEKSPIFRRLYIGFVVSMIISSIFLYFFTMRKTKFTKEYNFRLRGRGVAKSSLRLKSESNGGSYCKVQTTVALTAQRDSGSCERFPYIDGAPPIASPESHTGAGDESEPPSLGGSCESCSAASYSAIPQRDFHIENFLLLQEINNNRSNLLSQQAESSKADSEEVEDFPQPNSHQVLAMLMCMSVLCVALLLFMTWAQVDDSLRPLDFTRGSTCLGDALLDFLSLPLGGLACAVKPALFYYFCMDFRANCRYMLASLRPKSSTESSNREICV